MTVLVTQRTKINLLLPGFLQHRRSKNIPVGSLTPSSSFQRSGRTSGCIKQIKHASLLLLVFFVLFGLIAVWSFCHSFISHVILSFLQGTEFRKQKTHVLLFRHAPAHTVHILQKIHTSKFIQTSYRIGSVSTRLLISDISWVSIDIMYKETGYFFYYMDRQNKENASGEATMIKKQKKGVEFKQIISVVMIKNMASHINLSPKA